MASFSIPEFAYVSSRRLAQKGLIWLKSGPGGSVIEADGPPADTSSAKQFVILVHGYHSPSEQIAAYFHELIVALQRDGAAGSAFVVYDWSSTAVEPGDWLLVREYERRQEIERRQLERRQLTESLIRTDGINMEHDHAMERFEEEEAVATGLVQDGMAWNVDSYLYDREQAETTGADGLVRLISRLRQLNPQAEVDVIAHSMGCFVTEQAVERMAASAPVIHKMIWLAPDVRYDLFEDAKARAAFAAVEHLSIFYSRHDGVLYLAPREGGNYRMGRAGPKAASDPPNVTSVDLTDTLDAVLDSPRAKPSKGLMFDPGDTAIHGLYLETRSGVPEMVSRLVRR